MSLERVDREASLLEVIYFLLRSFFSSAVSLLENSRVGANFGVYVCLITSLTTLGWLAIS